MAGKLPSASEIVGKMLENARPAGKHWKGGLERARGTITSGMKASKDRYKQSMQDVISKDLWGKAIDKLTDDEIIAAATAVGDAAWLNGLTSREEKIKKAWEILAPRLQALKDKIGAMKNITDADREARMIENLREMRKLGSS